MFIDRYIQNLNGCQIPGLTVSEREKNLGLYALESNEATLESLLDD